MFLADIEPTLFDKVPPGWQVGLAVGLLVGLVLWLLGGRLARPGCALVGLVVGSATAALLAYTRLSPLMTLLVVIGAGIAGCLVAYLLFRVWMGISSAAILTLATAMICLSIVSATVPTGEQQMIETAAPAELAGPAPLIDGEVGAEVAAVVEDAEEAARDLLERAQAVLEQEWSDLKRWWAGQDASTQRTTMAAAGVAAVIGLLAGLIFPYFAASVQSALCGAGLITLCGLKLIEANTNPTPAWLPHTSWQLALTISLITALGLVLQWTLLRRKADK